MANYRGVRGVVILTARGGIFGNSHVFASGWLLRQYLIVANLG
jgi:hypothetical protein